MIISIWVRHDGDNIIQGFVHAFVLAVTIVVVSIPEGLPLAVTIALAYSTKKMYQDQCFIRVLAACETMGNATNICSDKTGTLTENRMTVVEGYFADTRVEQDDFSRISLTDAAKLFITENVSVNRIAYLVFKDALGKPLHRPNVIGSKTETVKSQVYDEKVDKMFSFNSNKKRSTDVIHKPNGIVRI
jgi:P-type E1-E2 ATPase